MPEPRRSQTDSDDFGTKDLILAARRPILIARHQELMKEMEGGLAEAFITGAGENPRLAAMLADLATPAEQQRVRSTLLTLSDDEDYAELTLRQALVEFLCLMREDTRAEVAALQRHCIGVYREVRHMLSERQLGHAPTLDELRELSTVAIGTLIDPPTPVFGRLGQAQVFTRLFIEKTLKDVRFLRQGDRPDVQWTDEDSAITITREDREQVAHLPEAERADALNFILRDRIRSTFYRGVFLEYFALDEFDPEGKDLPRTVLTWLQTMVDTPHLYPFLQGQQARQKAFRIARLTTKIVQLFEIHARIAQAEANPTHQVTLAGKTVREQLGYLVKHHVPPIAVTPEMTLSAMLCPFSTFARFVQERVGARDFVLPPDPKPAPKPSSGTSSKPTTKG